VKRWLSIIFIALLLPPVLLLSWLVTSESGLRWTARQAQAYLPGEINLTQLNGRLIGPIQINGLEYRFDGQLIEAERLALDWRPTELLAANIDISRLHLDGLKISLPTADTETPSATDATLTLPEISLPWRLGLKDVIINDIRIQRQEQTFQLTQLQLQASTLLSRIDIDRLSLHADNFSLNINGELRPSRNYRHRLNLAWTFKLASAEMLQGKGQLGGDRNKITLTQNITGPLELSLAAEIKDPLAHLSWQAKADIKNINTSRLDPALPTVSGQLQLQGHGDLNTASISGRADGHYPELGAFDSQFQLRRLADNSIQIEQLALHTPVTETQLNARGQWQAGPDGGNLDLALHWQKLRWPTQGSAWFDSANGSAWLNGNLAQYQFGIATDRPWPEAPVSGWYGSASGDLKGMDIHSLRVALLDGEAFATGRLDWADQFRWQADAKAQAINPAGLLPDWPGKLHATISSAGSIENGQLIAKADIKQLQGTLRGYPVALRSRLGWRDEGLDITDLAFNSGASNLKAAGRLAEVLSLEWSLDSPDLAELHPQAGGQLNAKGSLKGPRHSPDVVISFNGTGLNLLQDYGIGSINGDVAVDLFRWQHLDITLEAQSLGLKGHALQSAQLKGGGSDGQHQFRAEISAEAISSVIALSGKIDASGWQGRLEQADISTRQFDNWQLQTPVSLAINATKIQADPLCWLGTDAKICLRLQRQLDAWQAQLDAEQLPLLLLNPWLPPDLKLEGVANANADLKLQLPDLLLRGTARIGLPAGALSYPLLEGERDRWQYSNGLIEITLNDKSIRANSQLAMGNGDRFHARLALPGAELLKLDSSSQTLQGEAQLVIHKLELIEALVPEVQDIEGEAGLTLSVSGVLNQPRLGGEAYLRNGALRIPRLGLKMDQLSLEGKSDALESFDFRLSARSGEGMLTVAGKTRLDRLAGWPTQISIKGQTFEASRIPEARVLVSPDLRVEIQKRNIRIAGDIDIPYAKLQPKDITTAARISDDVVIVEGERVPLEKWLTFTKVRLTLGERVNFYGFGFDGRFGGSLLLEDEPGQLTRATGELTVPEGRYRAYGQRLDVEHGRLLYTGGPLSNPGIDLRAVRRIDDVTAGLKVRGSLNQPQIELFSIPAMGQTDALAYLLLGRPIEASSDAEGAMMAKAVLALGLTGGDRLARSLGDRFGLDEMRVESSNSGDQASLVMGRYLSPKLYVSYGVGLLESFNTLTLRYQISSKWQLKGESGEYQGADLLYTIER